MKMKMKMEGRRKRYIDSVIVSLRSIRKWEIQTKLALSHKEQFPREEIRFVLRLIVNKAEMPKVWPLSLLTVEMYWQIKLCTIRKKYIAGKPTFRFDFFRIKFGNLRL